MGIDRDVRTSGWEAEELAERDQHGGADHQGRSEHAASKARVLPNRLVTACMRKTLAMSTTPPLEVISNLTPSSVNPRSAAFSVG